MTTVGVVVGCYEHGAHLRSCLESVLGQSRPPDRVVVVDDGSTDGSQEIARSFVSAGVELVECDRVGTSTVFNTGVDVVGTDVVAILAADDACLPGRLQRQEQLVEHLGVELVLGLPIVIDDDGVVCLDELAPEFFEPRRSGRGHLFRRLFTSGNFLCASTAMFRRDAFRDLGGFHPGLLQLQDFHLWLMWSTRPVLVTDERYCRYRKSAGSLSATVRDSRMHSERAWIYRRILDEVPDGDLALAFDLPLDERGLLEDRHVACAQLLLAHPDPLVYQVGCERLLDIASGADGVARLERYGLSMQQVYALTFASDVTGSRPRGELFDELLDQRRA